MTIEKILITHFGWTEQEIKEKAKTIQYIKHINDEQLALDKAKFYLEEFNLSKAEFIKLLKVTPALLGLSEESVKMKLKFYQEEFGLEISKFVKMLKISPTLLTLAEESVKIKARFYQEEFNLSKVEFNKLLKVTPTLLGLSEESVKTKLKFYQEEFGFEKSEFIKMAKVLPALLYLSEESIMIKVKFYQEEFGLGKGEVVKIIKVLPTLLGLSEDSVREKHRQIIDLNIPTSTIVKKPIILAIPKNSLKIRYLILRQVVSREELLSSKVSWFMVNQDKIYARLMFIQSKQTDNIKLSDIIYPEQYFVKKHQINSDDLIKIYKLNQKEIYRMLSKIKDEEEIDFSDQETEFISMEYGV